jgi:hypothetical protein
LSSLKQPQSFWKKKVTIETPDHLAKNEAFSLDNPYVEDEWNYARTATCRDISRYRVSFEQSEVEKAEER